MSQSEYMEHCLSRRVRILYNKLGTWSVMPDASAVSFLLGTEIGLVPQLEELHSG